MSSPPAAETFEQLLAQQHLDHLVAFLLQLPKNEVVPVRKRALRLKKELEEYKLRHLHSGKQEWSPPITPQQSFMLFLTGLATHSRTEALTRSFEMPWLLTADIAPRDQLEKEAFWEVLRHSRPAWLAEWLQFITSSVSYPMLRQMEQEGLLEYHPSLFAHSVVLMLAFYSIRHKSDEGTSGYEQQILRDFRADPVLLQRDLLLLFDFDTPVDSTSTYTGRHQEPVVWLTVLLQLAASGHLDRTDLLRRSLLALRRDFRRPLLTWFRQVFLALQPSVAERLTFQSELTELLPHPLPLVVNFALDQLKILWAEAGFDVAPALLYAEGLMMRQDLKTTLRSLLGVFGKLLKAQPTLAPTLARLAATALANADTGVQERAAKLLTEILGNPKPLLRPAETNEITDTIGLYADLLRPSIRITLVAYLALAAPGEVETAAYVLLDRFEPNLSPATAIEPVRDWHELLFLTGQVFAQGDPGARERWLAGLLHLRHQYPAGYAAQLLPYAVRLLPLLRDASPGQASAIIAGNGFSGLAGLSAAMLVGWMQGFTTARLPHVQLQDTYYTADPLAAGEQQRWRAAEDHLRAGRSLPLLSTPTHVPCWVSPTALVERLLAYQQARQHPSPADLVIALARSAYAHAASARAALLLLKQLEDKVLRDLLEWFFGDAPRPVPAPGKSGLQWLAQQPTPQRTAMRASPATVAEALPELWAVAARTRYPEATIPELSAIADHPGVGAPWQPEWFFRQNSRTHPQTGNKNQPAEAIATGQELAVATRSQASGQPSALLLYSQHAYLPQQEHYYLWLLPHQLPTLLTLLPNHPASLHWHVVRVAYRTPEMGAESRDAMRAVLQTLLTAGPGFTESDSVVLALGLTHYAPACRALAFEVVVSRHRHGPTCSRYAGHRPGQDTNRPIRPRAPPCR